MCVSSRPRDPEIIFFCGNARDALIKCSLAKAASCNDFGFLVVDICVAFMHARTDEDFSVKVPSRIKISRFLATQGSSEWNEESIKAHKLVTNMLFQQNDINPCLQTVFVIIWTWKARRRFSGVWISIQCGSVGR